MPLCLLGLIQVTSGSRFEVKTFIGRLSDTGNGDFNYSTTTKGQSVPTTDHV